MMMTMMMTTTMMMIHRYHCCHSSLASKMIWFWLFLSRNVLLVVDEKMACWTVMMEK
jgi:hypothetical protein